MGTRSKLIKARERKGLTRKELAALLGISRHHVLRIELGYRNPRHEILVRWADELGISMDRFREDEPQPTQSAA